MKSSLVVKVLLMISESKFYVSLSISRCTFYFCLSIMYTGFTGMNFFYSVGFSLFESKFPFSVEVNSVYFLSLMSLE